MRLHLHGGRDTFWPVSGYRQGLVEGSDGRRMVVYGKNGAGQALADAVGRRVEVRYRRGDKGLMAVEARPVA